MICSRLLLNPQMEIKLAGSPSDIDNNDKVQRLQQIVAVSSEAFELTKQESVEN